MNPGHFSPQLPSPHLILIWRTFHGGSSNGIISKMFSNIKSNYVPFRTFDFLIPALHTEKGNPARQKPQRQRSRLPYTTTYLPDSSTYLHLLTSDSPGKIDIPTYVFSSYYYSFNPFCSDNLFSPARIIFSLGSFLPAVIKSLYVNSISFPLPLVWTVFIPLLLFSSFDNFSPENFILIPHACIVYFLFSYPLLYINFVCDALYIFLSPPSRLPLNPLPYSSAPSISPSILFNQFFFPLSWVFAIVCLCPSVFIDLSSANLAHRRSL